MIKVIQEEQPYEAFSTMGCRTVNGSDINFDKEFTRNIKDFIAGNDLKSGRMFSAAQKDGRGNIAPATIILPTIAMESKRKAEKRGTLEYLEDEFLSNLETAISECKDELIERYRWICAQSKNSAKFMYENKTMAGYDNEHIESSLQHGTLVIGQLGLAECLQILIGEDHTTKKGMELAKKIEKLYNRKCAEYKETYRLNFGVYFTPAESLCFTAMKKFKKKYGVIPNISDHDYFTNSVHVPVWKKVSPFEKIDIESQLTGFSNAGCITYVEFDDDARKNTEALEQVIDYAMEKDIPYAAINLPDDHCTLCGYGGVIDNECPKCGAKDENGNIQKLRRVTGYLSSDYRHFNLGKQSEVKDRFKHSTLMEN